MSNIKLFAFTLVFATGFALSGCNDTSNDQLESMYGSPKIQLDGRYWSCTKTEVVVLTVRKCVQWTHNGVNSHDR